MRSKELRLRDQVTIQVSTQNGWKDAMRLDFKNPEKGESSAVQLSYLQDYLIDECAYHYERCGLPATWIQTPIEFGGSYHYEKWPSFFVDLVPTGASQRYWREYLNLSDMDKNKALSLLLQRGAVSPIGNLRIKEAFEDAGFDGKTEKFDWTDAAFRMDDFVTHAKDKGLMVSGGTGAGGDAPKILLRMSEDKEVWIDPYPDTESHDDFYLVKFPRRQSDHGRATSLDKDILRTEFLYYETLSELGFETVDTDKLLLLDEGGHEPTLWIPRFDRYRDTKAGCWRLLGLESISASINISGPISHESVLRHLKEHLETHGDDFSFNLNELVSQWVVRDFLNVAFSNSDNHGRNSSLLKSVDGISLAPIYDFAPMAADHESIHRTLRWDKEIESSNGIAWARLPEHLERMSLGDASAVSACLINAMERCESLGDVLRDKGVPDSILSHPRVNMRSMPEKIKGWHQDLKGFAWPAIKREP